MDEIWKDIKGFEGYYQISNHGQVRSLDRHITWRGIVKLKKGNIMSSFCNKGYPRVSMCKNSKYTIRTVHKLVGLHFIDNPNNHPIIMHLDNDVKNSHYKNLKWGTYQENTDQAKRENRLWFTKIL